MAFVMLNVSSLCFVEKLNKTISWKVEAFHKSQHLFRIKSAILVVFFCLELQCHRQAVGEIGFCAVGELQVFPSVLWVSLCIVVFDESACTTDEEEFHKLIPVVGIIAFLECLYRADVYVVEFELENFPVQLTSTKHANPR